MQVARLHGPGDIRLTDEPVPAPAPGSSLVRVTAVGICGSDLHWWEESGIGDARLSRPLVLGHEIAGIIASGPRSGERVAVDPAIPCEDCRPCRDGYRNLCPAVAFAGHGSVDGGMREFLSWPAGLLHTLPDQVSDQGGALLEPLGVAAHAVDLGRMRLGGTAAVVGCGPIGLLVIQLLRLAGADRVIAFEPLAGRRQAAVRHGADQVLDPAGLPAGDMPDAGDLIPGGAGGADVAFEVAGTAAAVALAMAVARPGGRVVLAGIPAGDQVSFPASLARRKGLTIAMARRMNEAYPRAIRLAESARVDIESLVTSRFPVTAAARAMQAAARRDGLKVVIEPGGQASRTSA